MKIERVISGRLKGLACVCENFEKPHNAAAILRTCEALGILNVYIVEEDVPFEPAKGVTQGAEKWVILHQYLEDLVNKWDNLYIREEKQLFYEPSEGQWHRSSIKP